MATDCPHCGGTSCQDRFDEALALEFTDPPYGAVHHLTVTAFMLQHDRYSHDAWLAARALLDEFVRDGIGPVEARRRSAKTDASSTRPPGFAGFSEITWSRTLADVDFTDAEAYRRTVEQWAASVLDDTEEAAG